MFWQEVHKLDQQITLAINSWHSAISDPIMVFFSEKFVWAPMYAAIIAILIWRLGWKKGLIATAAALLTFGFCDQFSNIIKDLVERIRPVNDEFMVASGLHILERGGGYSFFSAHAANAVGLAFSTFICLREDSTADTRWINAYGGWMFFWAFMVSISRIFVGKHYLGDVIVGMITGAAAGIAFAVLARTIMRRCFTVQK